ncbi:alcohol dehydrogenase catalytic domain-containing protein [Natronomonas marina]|jgi:NADPH:quinone reductase-like Zn-dependent oxidoreductase|uniref:alcohol dehydrogenase catalytic domain-containing protein n=1 Tax=Natronomonas marina TaxID=2961939 RepID=UPI0020C9FB1E|nr:zinc-binding dehydrogenase [Natronomonas marina]
MRVAAFTGFGDGDEVAIRERPDPDPGPGEAVVDVEACSINRHDLWILQGDSALVSEGALPFVSGLDAAGVVRAAGEGAAVEAGDRVLLCPNETCGTCEYCREGPETLCEAFRLYHGALAEQALVEADRLIPLPESVGFPEAAALPTAYLTAWRMLKVADVGPTDLVFVPGATGGVGVAAVQLSDVLGAEAVGTSTSERKLKRLEELGCAHTVESADPEELVRAVRAVGQPDAVVNHLGGEFTQAGLEVMRRGGTMVICGRTAAPTSEFELGPFFLRHEEIVGSTMGTQPELATLVELLADGAFDPPVGGTYALAETGEAFDEMLRRDAFGKLVVEPGA